MSRPATTGSKGTTPVSFRLSATQRKRVEKAARPLGLSAGQFAAMVLLERIEAAGRPVVAYDECVKFDEAAWKRAEEATKDLEPMAQAQWFRKRP